MMKARTSDEFQSVIDDEAPVNYERNPQLAPAGAPSKLEQLVIRPGESGCVISHTEFELAKLCTEEKFKKRSGVS